MASPRMWQYVELLFKNFTLPHYILSFDVKSRSIRRGSRKEWKYLVFYIVHICSHFGLLIYYHLKSALSTTIELNYVQRSLLVIFALLFVSMGTLVGVFLYTIAFNEGIFCMNMNATNKFQSSLESK
jgi:hypothetical protein